MAIKWLYEDMCSLSVVSVNHEINLYTGVCMSISSIASLQIAYFRRVSRVRIRFRVSFHLQCFDTVG